MKGIVTNIIRMMPFLKRMPYYYSLRNCLAEKRQTAKIAEWERKGKPIPPHHAFKQRVLREYSKKFGLRILVETGTYYGDMVAAMQPYFKRIDSIELGKDLYEKALKRFEGVSNIELLTRQLSTQT